MQSLAVQRKLYQSFQSGVLLLTGRNEDDLYKASLRHPVRCTAFGSFTLSLLILVKNSCQEQADPGYGHSPKRKVCLHTQHTQACMYFQGTKCKRAVKAALNSRVPKAFLQRTGTTVLFCSASTPTAIIYPTVWCIQKIWKNGAWRTYISSALTQSNLTEPYERLPSASLSHPAPSSFVAP